MKDNNNFIILNSRFDAKDFHNEYMNNPNPHEIMDRSDIHISGKATYGAGGAPNNIGNMFGARAVEIYNKQK